MPSFRSIRDGFVGRCLAVVVLLAAGGGQALGQQFVDETATRFPSPNPAEYTNQLTIGDIDGDGDLDLIFANGQGFSSAGAALKARVFINNGLGIFTDQTDARTGGLSGWYRGAELGDCDLDGDLDVVLAQDFSHTPNLLVNNGAGVFTNETATRLPSTTLSSSRGQFGDVDNDGDLDLFFTNGGTNRFGCGQYRLYLNDGTCHYTDATVGHVPTESLCENMDCIFGDVDGDFDLDIRTASRGSNHSRLYRNNGSGVFSIVTTPPDGSCYSYDFGDMDGDGDLDLLGINALPGSSGELLLKNDGSGGYTNASSQLSPNPSEDDNDSKFIDYDNDGDLDLLIARLGGSGEKFYRNNGGGNFTQVTGLITTVSDSSLDVKLADLNADGTYDIVTAQGESGNFQNRIYINHGPSDSLPPRIIATEHLIDPPPPGPFVVRVAMLDDITSDRNFFDHGVTLHYSVNAGPDQTVPMRHSGGQIYRGVIPVQGGGVTVAYHVTAKDWNNNSAIGGGWSFSVPPAQSGAVPDGDSVPGNQLQVRILPNGNLRLSWAASCFAGDNDFAVYEGTLGTFTSHLPRTCSTSGFTSLSFPPPPGNVYYLVVPTNPGSEGSYGVDSNGSERPPSLAACRPQGVLSCP